MSDLTRRLDHLRAASGAKPFTAGLADDATQVLQQPILADLRQRMQRIERRPAAQAQGDIAEALGGRWVAPGLMLIEQEIPVSTQHGRVVLSELSAQSLVPLGGPETPIERLLFFDTETTGLAGGTGTLAFLLGMARVERSVLRVRQLFLTGFAGEPAMLDLAAQWIDHDTHLVSFNGKSFDQPLLASRFRLAGKLDPFAGRPHLDLMHATRRAFATRWDDCRLQTAERRLLGFERVDDLPGFMVPQVWFDFVRDGISDRVPGILEHNRWDVVSMAALLPRLAAAHSDADAHSADVLAVARAYAKRGDPLEAERQLSVAVERPVQATLELAWLKHRRGDQSGALALWTGLAERGVAAAWERLTIYHEHAARDPHTALYYARLLAATGRQGDMATALQRRIDRLLRKAGNCETADALTGTSKEDR